MRSIFLQAVLMSSSALVLDQLGIDYVEPPPGLKYTPNDVGLSWPEMNDTRELQVRILA